MSGFRNRLLIFIPLLLIGIVAYFVVDVAAGAREQVVSRFSSYQSARAQQLAREVESYLGASAHSVLHVARLAYGPGGEPSRIGSELENFSTPTPGLPPSTITGIDGSGNVLFSTSQTAQAVEFATPNVVAWAKNPVNRGKVLISSGSRTDPLYPTRRNDEGLYVATPLWRGASPSATGRQRWMGLLVMTLDLKSLMTARVPLLATGHQDVHAWIVDQNGTVLFQSEHPEMSHVNIGEKNATCGQCHVSFDYVERALKAKNGTSEYQLKGGPMKLAAYAPIAFANASWIVVLNAPQRQVIGFVQDNLRKVLLLLAMLVVAFLMLSWFLYLSTGQRAVAEQALGRLKDQHALILSSVTEGILGLDDHGCHTFVNPAAARMLGYEADELIGRPSHQTWHHTRKDGSAYDAAFCPIYAAYKDGQIHRAPDDVFWRKDGSQLEVEYTSTPIMDDRHPSGAVVTFRDISEQRRLELQRHQGQKMAAIGTLAGGIAHDFNNILGAIVGNTELMSAELAPDDPAQESVREILKATHRATELVRQILTFSRQQERARSSTDVGAIVKEALKLLRATLPATIAFRTDLAEGAPPVLADPIQIYQLLVNLVSNAAHSMRERGGELTVQLRPVVLDTTQSQRHVDLHEGLYLCLSVSDTGHGMSADTLGRVFEPFFTTKQLGEGTGLGLAVVHGIVESHPHRRSRLGRNHPARYHAIYRVHGDRSHDTVPLSIGMQPVIRRVR